MTTSKPTEHVLTDILEPVNRYFHIPVSAKIVEVLARTPVTPNQVTYVSVLLGIASGYFFSKGSPSGMILGGLCLELSLILDCVDGQLARATGQSSEWGRLLDGIGGYIAYLAVVWGIWIALPEHSLALKAITIFSILKAISFDYCKQYFTAKAQEGSDGSRIEILNAYTRWKRKQLPILKIYFYYLQFQQWIFHGRSSSLRDYDEEKERIAAHTALSEFQRKDFFERARPLISLWRWNGHEFCLFLLAVFAIFNSLETVLNPFACIMCIQFILTLILHRRLIPEEMPVEHSETSGK